MTLTRFDRLPWSPVTIAVTDGRDRLSAATAAGSVEISLPRLFLSDPAQHSHIAIWRHLPAATDEDHSSVDVDDSAWYTSARVNDITFGFPTWEGSSFRGVIWFRSSVVVPESEDPLELVLGSPQELRDLRWGVWLDGLDAGAPERVDGGMVAVPLGRRDPGQTLQVAVRLEVDREWPSDEVREREGWKILDLFCQQMVAPIRARTQLAVESVEASGLQAVIRYRGGVTATLVADEVDGALRLRTALDGPPEAWVSSVEIATPTSSTTRSRHDEGAWVLDGDRFQAIAHPAGITLMRPSETASVVWPGAPVAGLRLPEVLIGRDVRSLLHRIGRDATPYRIYDPYGWYQISHAAEPKSEIDAALMGEIGELLERLRSQGVEFDAISVDCGWNDPDDLSRFNPTSFPDGIGALTDVLDRHRLDLLLWVSPSDGPRAFRHELGMANPGMDAAQSGNPVMPWRLCPGAEPWRTAFREALVALARDTGAKGFKVDGTDLWCASVSHDHAPGVYSVYANTTALAETFGAVVEAGASFLMMYWGLRSPWWLRWAATLWERDYLVEAAGPSGGPAWSLRLGVASSQDIGSQRSWATIPPQQQDSLGVWISDKIWASHQGSKDWADAYALEAARGSRLQQLWGDLRRLDNPLDLGMLRAIDEAIGSFVAGASSGDPFGRAWNDDAYGYRWRSADGELIVVARPGDGGGIDLDCDGSLQGATVVWASPGAVVGAEIRDGIARVTQSGGSVAAVLLTPGASRPQPSPRRPVADWSLVDATTGDAVSDELVTVAYLGRAPQIVSYFHGDDGPPPPIPEMRPKVPVDDRAIVVHRQRWTGTVELETAADLAVVAAVSRRGAAWHNDRLHELVSISIAVNGAVAPADRWPTFPHQQAGGWSSVVDVVRLAEGAHRIELVVEAAIPESVDLAVHRWLR